MGNGLDAWRPGAEATLQAYQKRFSLPAPCNDPENDRNRSRLKEECMSLSPATLLQVRDFVFGLSLDQDPHRRGRLVGILPLSLIIERTACHYF